MNITCFGYCLDEQDHRGKTWLSETGKASAVYWYLTSSEPWRPTSLHYSSTPPDVMIMCNRCKLHFFIIGFSFILFPSIQAWTMADCYSLLFCSMTRCPSRRIQLVLLSYGMYSCFYVPTQYHYFICMSANRVLVTPSVKLIGRGWG